MEILTLVFSKPSIISDNVMFVRDFNSKLEAFGCAKKNTSGPMLKTIQNQLNLIYLNTDEHTHLDRYTGNTDILDMAFISPNLSKHDIQFLMGDDLGTSPSKSQSYQDFTLYFDCTIIVTSQMSCHSIFRNDVNS